MSEKKSLLFYVQLPPPTHGTSADNQRMISSERINRAFEVSVYEMNSAKNVEDIERWSIGKILLSIVNFLGLLYTALRENPDAIYMTPAPHGPAFYRDVSFIKILKILGFILIARVQGRGFRTGSHFKRQLSSCMLHKTYPIVLSERLKYDIEPFTRTERIYVLPNGIPDVSVTPQDHGTDGKQENDVVSFLYLSNWHPSKGLLQTIEALSVLPENAKFELRIVGNPTEELPEAIVRDKISEEELDNCTTIPGPLYGDEKLKEYERSDVFVFPTRYRNECFPFVIIEAMRAGLPIVSTKLAAIPDMVDHGKNGYLIDPNFKIISLAQELEKLLNSRKKRTKFGKRSRDMYKDKFQLEILRKDMIEILRDILSD